jgi:hypothetical protein
LPHLRTFANYPKFVGVSNRVIMTTLKTVKILVWYEIFVTIKIGIKLLTTHTEIEK